LFIAKGREMAEVTASIQPVAYRTFVDKPQRTYATSRDSAAKCHQKQNTVVIGM